MFDVITFGGATRDIFFKTAKGVIFPDPEDVEEKMLAFKYGQKVITDNADFSFGGGAFNTAVCMAKQGLTVATHINVGRDESAYSIVQQLKFLEVDTSLVTTDPKNHTAMSILIIDKKDHVAFLHRGANNFLKTPPQDKLKKTKWFFITSLTGESAKMLPDLIEFAYSNNIKVALNPGEAQLKDNCHKFRELLKGVELLILNREEAETLICSSETCDVIEDNNILLSKARKIGAKRVIITEGAKGSYYADNELVNFEPVFKEDGIGLDTTGAGDTYGATFLTNIIQGVHVSLAQKRAAVNSASVTEYIGAQKGLLTPKEIEAKLKKTKVI